jgi:glycosyltransferase involved in cell wall biosynthesis
MKIAIDARFIGPDGTGIGRYTQELVDNLETIDQTNEYWLLLRQANFDLVNPANPKFHKVLADAPWYSPQEQVVIPKALRQINPDLTHFPYDAPPLLSTGKTVITIHDLTKADFSGTSSSTKSSLVYQIKRFVYATSLSRGAKRAIRIIVPTNTTRDKVIKDLHVNPEKVVVTYEAADTRFFEWGEKKINTSELEKILNKYHLKKPFIIYTGNVYPYKNLNKLVEALTLLPRDISLVCVGRHTLFHDRLASFAATKKISNRVLMPGFIPDEDLATLYRAAEAYVFPSLSEGFGLPALEAMASRLPVICSAIPVLREICGDNAIYFDPQDPSDIASKINLLLADLPLRESLIKEGLERAQQFSWRKMATQTLQVYQEAVK